MLYFYTFKNTFYHTVLRPCGHIEPVSSVMSDLGLLPISAPPNIQLCPPASKNNNVFTPAVPRPLNTANFDGQLLNLSNQLI